MPSTPSHQPAIDTGASPDDLLAADTVGEVADYNVSEPSTIVPDVLDETSITEQHDLAILLGNRISANLSSQAPFTISKDQMTISDESSGFQTEEWGWDSPEEVPSWASQMVMHAFTEASMVPPRGGSVMLCSTGYSTLYADPDQGILTMAANVPVYSHMSPIVGSVIEPVINEASLRLKDSTSKYGSATYLDPLHYDPKEERSLQRKFGFDAVAYSPSAYDATYERLQDELADALEMMSIEFEPRQNIRKTTAAPSLFDNFETITLQERVEDASLVEARFDDSPAARRRSAGGGGGTSGGGTSGGGTSGGGGSY